MGNSYFLIFFERKKCKGLAAVVAEEKNYDFKINIFLLGFL